MPKFSVKVPHQLTKEDAIERLKKFGELIESRYRDKVGEVSHTWEGDALKFAFSTMGFKIAGGVEASESEVAVNGDLPFAAMMFKGTVESSIRDELTKLLRT